MSHNYISLKTEKCIIFILSFMLLIGSFMLPMGGGRVNAQSMYAPIDAVIVFECDASKQLEENRYQITIKGEADGIPTPQQSTLDVDAPGKGSFTVRVTEPGTYDYLLFQVKGGSEKVIYDSTVYEVHVFVISNDMNELEYSVSVNIADTDIKPDALKFQNLASKKNTGSDDQKTSENVEGDSTKNGQISSGISQNGNNSAGGNGGSNSLGGQEGSSGGQGSYSGSAKTGDPADINLAFLLMAGSFLMAGLMIGLRKKRNS